mgnify:CR=1 FL=1
MIDATYVDHMGTDLSVVNAARVSFAKESSWTVRGGEYSLSDKDINLINDDIIITITKKIIGK